MNSSNIKDVVHDFIFPMKSAALATVDKNASPHVSTIFCTVDSKLRIYFVTVASGRKYDNLLTRPMVAMSISDEENLITVQLTGIALPLRVNEVENDVLALLWRIRFQDKNWPMPPIQMYEKRLTNELAVFQITPKEMTYACFESTPEGKYHPLFQKVI